MRKANTNTHTANHQAYGVHKVPKRAQNVIHSHTAPTLDYRMNGGKTSGAVVRLGSSSQTFCRFA